MKKLNYVLLLGLSVSLLSFTSVNAQEISTHMHRRVAPGDMQEYLKRETTYWQKFAESEIEKGNLTFWAVFQKVSGADQENSPNILIINTFKDLDKGVDWNGVAALFPDLKMEDIQTWNLATTTDQIYVRNLDNHIQVDNPEFNFIHILYHDVKNTGVQLTFDSEKWKPMLQKAMADGKTNVQGWGNGLIVSPESEDFAYGTYSYDLFSSTHAALSPYFSADHELSDGFFNDLNGNQSGPRNAHLFRIVAVANAQGD